jgi:hypothetical protein
MKKKHLFSLALALLLCVASPAQVVNGDFETITCNFIPSNWGMTFLQATAIDPQTGESVGDQIQYTWCIPSMVYVSTEPQSGSYAMEISNAFNSTQNIVIPGISTIFSDPEQSGPGWNPGISVAPDASVFMLGFYYKFLPAGNDIAQARITVSDAEGNEIGQAAIDISGMHDTYQYIYEPITFTSTAAPASMIISFSMAKEGSTPSFGSRLIVDNVVTNFAALQLDTHTLGEGITVYPTLVEHDLNVATNGLTQGPITYTVVNTEGKIVKQNRITGDSGYVYSMDVSQLATGLYFLNIDSSLGHLTKKFLKK